MTYRPGRYRNLEREREARHVVLVRFDLAAARSMRLF